MATVSIPTHLGGSLLLQGLLHVALELGSKPSGDMPGDVIVQVEVSQSLEEPIADVAILPQHLSCHCQPSVVGVRGTHPQKVAMQFSENSVWQHCSGHGSGPVRGKVTESEVRAKMATEYSPLFIIYHY